MIRENILSNIAQHHYFLQIEQQGANAALGINESGGDELGIQFAETVTIRCD